MKGKRHGSLERLIVRPIDIPREQEAVTLEYTLEHLLNLEFVFAEVRDRARSEQMVPSKNMVFSFTAMLCMQVLALSAAEAAPSARTCTGMFKRLKAQVAQGNDSQSDNSAVPAVSSSRELQRTLPIAGRFSFAEIRRSGRMVDQVVQSQDSRYVAIVHSGEAPIQLDIVDLQSGEAMYSEGFTRVKSVHFIPGSEMVAVDGTRTADGQVAKLFVIPFLKSVPGTEVATSKPSGPAIGTDFVSSAMQLWFGSWLTPTTAPPPTPAKNPDYLKLPASPFWGVGVTQVVGRPGLPVVVVQDSGNALDSNYSYGGGGRTSLLNQGATLIDPVTMQPTGSLTYDNLNANRVDVSPVSSFAAVNLVDPVVAHKKRNIVGVVDLAQPKKLIYKYQFAEASVDLPSGPYAVTGQSNLVSSYWSADGQSVVFVELRSGTVVKYDLARNRESVSERRGDDRWPTVGAAVLSDGSIFILRQGQMPSGLARTVPRKLFGYVAESVHAFSELKKPDFELNFDNSPLLYPRNGSDLINAQAVLEMQNGRMIVVVMDGQVIAFDRENPQVQVAVGPNPPSERVALPMITSAQKLDESTIRLSDRENGVFDILIPAPR